MYLIRKLGGDRYLTINTKTGKVCETNARSKAKRFDNESAAKNFITSSVAKSVRDRYQPIFIADAIVNQLDKIEVDEPVEETVTVEAEPSNKILNENFDWKVYFTQLNQIVQELPSYIEGLKKGLQDAEYEKLDLEHYIEFNDVGTVQGYKLNKLEQDLRRKRRKLKDAYQCATAVSKELSNLSFDNLFKYLEHMETRIYIPRVLTDLFRNGI